MRAVPSGAPPICPRGHPARTPLTTDAAPKGTATAEGGEGAAHTGSHTSASYRRDMRSAGLPLDVRPSPGGTAGEVQTSAGTRPLAKLPPPGAPATPPPAASPPPLGAPA